MGFHLKGVHKGCFRVQGRGFGVPFKGVHKGFLRYRVEGLEFLLKGSIRVLEGAYRRSGRFRVPGFAVSVKFRLRQSLWSLRALRINRKVVSTSEVQQRYPGLETGSKIARFWFCCCCCCCCCSCSWAVMMVELKMIVMRISLVMMTLNPQPFSLWPQDFTLRR